MACFARMDSIEHLCFEITKVHNTHILLLQTEFEQSNCIQILSFATNSNWKWNTNKQKLNLQTTNQYYRLLIKMDVLKMVYFKF